MIYIFEFISRRFLKQPSSSFPLIYESKFEKGLLVNNLPCGVMPGELLDIIPGDDMGAPETGVPGLLPICLGEFIMPAGEDMGREVAGDPGLGLAIAPGGTERGPDCG